VNQDRAADTKEKMKALSAELKKATPERQKELMSESMAQQRQLMRMNMKPMLLSFAVVALLLPWLAGYYHDVNVSLVNGTGNFTLSSNGAYSLDVANGALTISGNGVQISTQLPSDIFLAGNTWHASEIDGNVRLSLIAATLPGLPLVGGVQLGWIWWYILVSIPLAIIIRAIYGIRV
jgi:uncharacterized membrane protein (DUF106 family)